VNEREKYSSYFTITGEAETIIEKTCKGRWPFSIPMRNVNGASQNFRVMLSILEDELRSGHIRRRRDIVETEDSISNDKRNVSFEREWIFRRENRGTETFAFLRYDESSIFSVVGDEVSLCSGENCTGSSWSADKCSLFDTWNVSSAGLSGVPRGCNDSQGVSPSLTIRDARIYC